MVDFKVSIRCCARIPILFCDVQKLVVTKKDLNVIKNIWLKEFGVLLYVSLLGAINNKNCYLNDNLVS